MVDDTDDQTIRRVLNATRKIALVGASPNPARPSHDVGTFLLARGYDVIPVNPSAVGQEIFGVPVVASLSEAGDVDFVDVFRRSEHASEVIDEALGLETVRAIWLQLGVRDDPSATRARAAGRDVIQDRCPKIEIARLGIMSPQLDPQAR